MDGADTKRIEPPLVGLDDRPRPASTRDRMVQGLKQSAPFSSLQRRIIFFNLAGLAFLVLGILYLTQFRSGLIDQRVDALRTQAEIIAITVAESAWVEGDATAYDPVRANHVLSRLVVPTGTRARIFDTRLRMTGDTRSLAPDRAPIAATPLDPIGDETIGTFFRQVERAYDRFHSMFDGTPTVANESSDGGISRDSEVLQAAAGVMQHAIRINSQGEIIVSVAVPLVRLGAVMGVVVLSTEGGDITRVVRRERAIILQVFIFAAIVSMALSIILANTIARPIRKLATAADTLGKNAARPLNPDRIEIPDMTRRSDEIGELSAALIRMTEALYRRIDAIESFASDVAHEIKNPLTSLRSAVETMAYAKTPEQRQRLVDIIQNDVGRMDRLVTDISNASRLDAELVRERMQTFRISDLVTMLASVTAAQGEDREVRVETRLPRRPVEVRGLESRIAQVITNLLDNALSFSPPGATITVTVEHESAVVRVSVLDEGPGVPPENLETIFTRFYTERPDSEDFGQHSGLGLSISKQIVEAHDGRIWVENCPDPDDPDIVLGARFTFELPA
ncbi:MAG: stimulus-sensing domain-containing protein [Paracoccaceae bacterium]